MRQAFSRLSKSELTHALRDEANLNGANLADVDLAGVNLARCNLSGARFNGADLSGSYLQGTIARRASFIRANMSGVALPAASLEGAGFYRADLSGANLSWADLREASLVEANLSDAQLFQATLNGAALTDANLTGARLDSVDLAGAILQRAQLSNTVLHGASLQRADLYGADLRRADIRGADFGGANLIGAQLGGAKYDESTVFPAGLRVASLGMYFLDADADLTRIDLEDFELKGQDLSRSNLSNANLVGADLRGADLRHADMTGTRLRRALYDADTTFPDGFDPEASGAYALGPGAIIRFARMQWKHLRDAALSGAELVGADLTGADLSGAALNSADLTKSTLYTANFTGAALHGAILRDANARGAIFRDADLRRADLRGGDFSWADFAGADLRGAQLAGSLLTDARLRGARFNDDTTFPTAFDPAAERMMGGDGGVSVAGRPRRADEPEGMLASARRHAARQRLLALGVAGELRSRVASTWVARALGYAAARVLTGPTAWVSMSGGATIAIVLLSGALEGSPDAPRVVTETTGRPVALASAFFVVGSDAITVTPQLPAGPPAGPTIKAADVPPEDVEVQPTVRVRRAVRMPEERPPMKLFAVLGAGPIDPYAAPVQAIPLVGVATAAVVVSPERAVDPASVVVARATEEYVAPSVAPDGVGAGSVADAAVSKLPAAGSEAPRHKAAHVAAAVSVDPSPVDAGAEAVDDVANGVDTASVAAAVEQWRGVWEGRDVSGYADMFHPEAAASRRSLGDPSLSAPRFTKVTLEARAANLFSQYARISVAVGALDIKRDGDLLVSSFDQDFTAWRSGSDSSPAYVDRGRKTLVFARDRNSEWRIVSEQWRSRSQ